MTKEHVELDERDLLILKALNSGALIVSLKRVQELTGLNKQLIYSRIKKMQDSAIITDFVTRLSFHKFGLSHENMVFYKLDMEKLHKMGEEYILSVTKDNPHIVRMKPLIPNSDYHLFANEVFLDANNYYEYTQKMYKQYPELMSLIKERLVFTVNNDDELMNKIFHINAVIDAYAAAKNYDVTLKGKTTNGTISITK